MNHDNNIIGLEVSTSQNFVNVCIPCFSVANCDDYLIYLSKTSTLPSELDTLNFSHWETSMPVLITCLAMCMGAILL